MTTSVLRNINCRAATREPGVKKRASPDAFEKASSTRGLVPECVEHQCRAAPEPPPILLPAGLIGSSQFRGLDVHGLRAGTLATWQVSRTDRRPIAAARRVAMPHCIKVNPERDLLAQPLTLFLPDRRLSGAADLSTGDTRARREDLHIPGFSLGDTRFWKVPDRVVLDLLALAEIGLILAAAMLAKLIYIGGYLQVEENDVSYGFVGISGGLLIVYMLRLAGLYTQSKVADFRDNIFTLLCNVVLGFLLLIAAAYLFKVSVVYSRGWLLTWFLLSSTFILFGRSAASWFQRRLILAGHIDRRIAIIGDPIQGNRLAEKLRNAPGIRVVGLFVDSAQPEGEPAYPSVADLVALGQRDQFDEVVVELAEMQEQRVARLVQLLSVLPVDVWLCPTSCNLPIVATSQVGAASLLKVHSNPIRDWGFVHKIALDYTIAIFALLVFAVPMLLIALAIKIDSKGPVFFRQRRHGYNHRVISVFKFRTMHVAEDGDSIEQARHNDPRVTRVGRILRKLSLDELPQLFNVLTGQMSVVGPRPHALAHNALYASQLQRYANRHCVKPGITGWAQIKGFRGPTENPDKMAKRIELDLFYIANWSIWFDLKILALTPMLGFTHRNAV
jgi:Undecaprenyl-phosphate glucose phosphotransferase